ncbi:unnamed protein product [Closterium sp. NIES-53]
MRVLYIKSVPSEDKHAKLADDVVKWFARVVALDKLEPDVKKLSESEGLGFESLYVHFGHPSAGGCQRSTGDPRLILGKGYSHSEGLGFESQCVHFGHPNAGGCQRIVKHACDLAVEIVLAEPAVHKMAGTRSTALHTAAVYNAASTVAEAVKENPLAKKTPDGDNAERVSKAAGDSSAGINSKVDDAANEKENATPTAGKNIVADGMDKASPPRATECRMEVASRAGDSDASRGRRPSAEELAKTQERQLAQQREMLSEMMGSAEETQAGFERALRTMNRLVTRVEESNKRRREDVTNAVQELRVERANATSQRKTAALTLARVEAAVVELKSMIFSGGYDAKDRDAVLHV